MNRPLQLIFLLLTIITGLNSGQGKSNTPTRQDSVKIEEDLSFNNNIIKSLGGYHSQWDLGKFSKIDSIPYIYSRTTFKVNPPQIISDGFTHTVYLDREKLVLYINRRGGVFNVNELYGPIKIDSSGFVATEPTEFNE